MNRTKTLSLALVMLAVGYWWGAAGLSLRTAKAQDKDLGISDETTKKIRDAYRRLTDARDALANEGRYESITTGVNAFLVFSGGGNARQDLESGRGVDPETFAGLYAGRAIPEVQALLGTDDLGRITYNNEVVRMYSKSRLQQVFAKRTHAVELEL